MTEVAILGSGQAVAWRASYDIPDWFILCFTNTIDAYISIGLSTADKAGVMSLYGVVLQPSTPEIYTLEQHSYWTHPAAVIRNGKRAERASFGFSLETGRVILIERDPTGETKMIRRSSPIHRIFLHEITQ